MRKHYKFWKVLYLLAEFMVRAWLIAQRREELRPQSFLLLDLFRSSSRRILKTMNVEVELKGRTDLITERRPYIVVGNHSSYLDMIILGSVYPCIFVSSVERRDDGPIGKLAQAAGTIFVDRVNKSRLPEDVETLARHMAAGVPLCLYLEGTTSNGRTVLPFKSSLLGAIEDKDVEILPVCLRYTHADGRVLAGDAFDQIAWYGAMSFLPHFRRINSLRSIRAELTILDPIRTRGELCRKTVASAAHSLIHHAFYAS